MEKLVANSSSCNCASYEDTSANCTCRKWPTPLLAAPELQAGENPVKSHRAKLHSSSSGTPQLDWHSLTRSSAWGQLPKCTLSSIPGLPPEPAPFPHLPLSLAVPTQASVQQTQPGTRQLNSSFHPEQLLNHAPCTDTGFYCGSSSSRCPVSNTIRHPPQVTNTAANSHRPYPHLLGFTSQFPAIPLDGDEDNCFYMKIPGLYRDEIADALAK